MELQKSLADYIYHENGFYSLFEKIMENLVTLEPVKFKALIISKKDQNEERNRKLELNRLAESWFNALDNSNPPFKEWKKKVLSMLIEFGKRPKGEQDKALLDDSGLGMLLFTSLISNDELSPTHELELDCRGYVKFEGYSVSIVVGEIKSNCSTDSTRRAVHQLYLATTVLEKTVNAVSANTNYTVHKTGILFFPLRQKKNYLNPPITDRGFEFNVQFL
jgi:hypothetical protein